MISGAEAERIGRALGSVSDWVSEIVVVLNQEVHDGTEELARQHGAKVFREPWKGHIAQKNSAADKATGEWLLGLDADEAVSSRLRDEIVGAVADRGAGEFAAYSFPRLSRFGGRWIRHGDWYPDRQTRLWRKGKAHWGGVDPHDKLIIQGRVGRLRGDLHHFTSDSIDSRVRKIIPFSDEFVRQHAQVHPSLFDLVLRPWWRFFRAYVLRLGFLDGWEGYYIASHMAFSTLVRYAKLREKRNSRSADAGARKPDAAQPAARA
jgi:glycosyltransferase involved in cell wall biosynthesis